MLARVWGRRLDNSSYKLVFRVVARVQGSSLCLGWMMGVSPVGQSFETSVDLPEVLEQSHGSPAARSMNDASPGTSPLFMF